MFPSSLFFKEVSIKCMEAGHLTQIIQIIIQHTITLSGVALFL